ncbi:MAG: hypothetical protein WCT04_25945 [Planctomycetota bacterium]
MSIIAVLAMVFGGLNLCFAPVGIVQLFISKDPIHDAMRNDPALYYFTVVSGIVGWFISAVSVALGSGLWRMKEWARKGMVVYYCVTAVWTLVGGIFSTIYITPKIMEISMAMQPQKLPAGVMDGIKLGSMIGAGVMILLFCGVYIFIAQYLARPSVKAAFREME